MIRENRALWKYIVFGILTFGIYDFYFIYKMAQDVNVMCADDGKKMSGLIVFILLCYLTCGIYALIWYYSLANRLAENAPRYGLYFQENGTTVLMWHIFGMLLCGIGAFVAMHILIKNTNELARAYNSHSGNHNPGWNEEQQSKKIPQSSMNRQNDNQIPPMQAHRTECHQNQASLMHNSNASGFQQNSYTESETTILSLHQMQSQTPPKAILYFVQTQQSITIDQDEFKVGKNSGMSDYVISNSVSVSRQHAVIQRRNGQFYLTDLGSTNGTFVNEKRISGTVQLQDGDNIRYADVISVFNIMR